MVQVIAIVFLVVWFGWSIWFLRDEFCPGANIGDYLASLCAGVLLATGTFIVVGVLTLIVSKALGY